MPPKRQFNRKRKSGFRDSRLIVIATEGEKTEKKYFEDFSPNSRVGIEVLPNIDSQSSPLKVIELLNGFKSEYKLNRADELWLVIDVDRWGEGQLSEVARLCGQKDYHLAVSNPCFEFWLLLHKASIDQYSETRQQELLDNGRFSASRNQLQQELLVLCGEYNGANLRTEDFIPYVDDAISRAESLDSSSLGRWPSGLGSRVYLLAKSIKGITSNINI